MTLSSALSSLSETASVERAGDRVAARLEDVRSILSRELASVEEVVAAAIRGGVAPATDAANHLFASGGKRVRPMSLLLATACFGPIGERARELAAVSEMIHMATLLHDDVIDDGDQRRGQPTSRRVWGNAVSVLSGDLLLVESLRLASRASTETWTELVATLGRLVDGEVVQLRGRTTLTLEEATYFAVVRGKTASLFEWTLRAGAREASAPRAAVDALGAFGAHIGTAFQLVDDVLDYDADEAATGKSMFADLAEGKVTLPLLRAAANDPEIFPLVERVRGGDADGAAQLAKCVRESSACESVRELAREETTQALRNLDVVPACRAKEVLADVARGLAARVS